MINNKKILIIVPARGGSKGIPKKNIKILGSKPLILHTIDIARSLFNDDQICVSTDDIIIKKAVEDSGLEVPFLRPDSLATDTASTFDVIMHVLDFYENSLHKIPKIILLLQPTSPFREKEDIENALNLFLTSDCDMVVSVKESKSNPYYNLFEENIDGWLVKSKQLTISRRQDSPKVWEYNGAIYVVNSESFKNQKNFNFKRIKKFVMDEKSSHDIDTIFDWKIAEYLINE